jgi:transposase
MAATRSLTPRQHDELLQIYRKNPDPELRSRAHIILLLAEGHPWATIKDVLFCSRLTIDRWLKRFEPQGAEGLAGRKRGCPFRFGLGWVAVLVVWVTKHTPRDFSFRRSRWACTALVLLLRERHDVSVSRETARRWLHRGNLVYPPPPAGRRADRPGEGGQDGRVAKAGGWTARRRDDRRAG